MPGPQRYEVSIWTSGPVGAGEVAERLRPLVDPLAGKIEVRTMPAGPAPVGPSSWRHAVCDPCWAKLYPALPPTRQDPPLVARCCWCDAQTRSGITVGRDPARVRCGGQHEAGGG